MLEDTIRAAAEALIELPEDSGLIDDYTDAVSIPEQQVAAMNVIAAARAVCVRERPRTWAQTRLREALAAWDATEKEGT